MPVKFQRPTDWPRASKERILKQADALHAEARQARRGSAGVKDEAQRQLLARHIADLEANAARLEKSAIEAKSG